MKKSVCFACIGIIGLLAAAYAQAAEDTSCVVMDSNGKSIYVAWENTTDGALYLTESSNWGANFTVPVKITEGSPGVYTNPVLALDSPGNLYAAWQDENNSDIYFGRRLKGEALFEVGVVPVDVALPASGEQTRPVIHATASGTVYLAWANSGEEAGIYLATDQDQGTGLWTLSAEAVTRVDNQTTSAAPQNPGMGLDASGNNKYFVWQDTIGGEQNVYYNRLDRLNARVHEQDIVINDLPGAAAPSIAIRPNAAGGDNPNIFVAWQQSSANGLEIYLDKSADGSLWGIDTAVNRESTPPRNQAGPRIAADSNGDVFVVWSEELAGDRDVYATYSLDRGETFKTSLLINNEETNGTQENPSLRITSDGRDFGVSWTDRTEGAIYFNRNTIVEAASVQETLIDNAAGGTASANATSSIAEAQVVIPPGALEAPLVVSISNVLITPPFFNGDTQIDQVIDFGPSGTTFAKPVTITIPYERNDLSMAAVTDENLLRIYYYNLKTLLWERIDSVSVDPVAQTISAQVSHFSLFGLGATAGGAGSSGYTDKGNCFIATAAYGSDDAPEVAALRAFRDRYLLTSSWGRGLVRFYYAHSPRWATYIADKPEAKALVRTLLKPVVYAITDPVCKPGL